MMELTGEDRVFIVPMLIAVVLATLVSRTIEQRSIYEARLSNQDVADRVRAREPQGNRGVAKPAQGDPL
jgi:CIC family chloride channel protein